MPRRRKVHKGRERPVDGQPQSPEDSQQMHQIAAEVHSADEVLSERDQVVLDATEDKEENESNTSHKICSRMPANGTHSLHIGIDQRANYLLQETTPKVIVEDTQATRQETLQRECLQKNISSFPQLAYDCELFRVLPNQRSLLLLVPKCGGTNWGRLLLTVNGFKPADEKVGAQQAVTLLKKHFKYLKSIKNDERKHYASNFTKIIFVRNPFTRLLAAFRDRLEAYPNRNLVQRRVHNKKIYMQYGNHSKAKMPKASVKSEMYNVTFKEFIDYFLASHNDIHWQDVYKICNPCLGYDFIGKLETYDKDVMESLKLMGVDSKFYPYKALDVSNSSDDAIMKKYYATLSDKQFEKVKKRLSTDMAYFGYKMPESIRRD
ncbi:carbohydrate sulfotransferase 9-like [Diadema setosum]|uniref:carbohydrate sulfotransferase 9-like n=1 Tax=Diadema setosum TaxID=31175 RepID=UPI003B3B693B